MSSDPTQPHDDSTGDELPDRLLAKLRIEVPGYELLGELGSGGQATVYRARELTSGLTVAIKILHGGQQADDAARERFRRETAALKAINHPNIVCVIESGRTPAELDFLVMNFVDGKPLDTLWADRKFAATFAPDPTARLRLFKRICNVMQAAHRRGITHRDLSPSNILIDARNEPHILDFGLAATAFDTLHGPANRHVTMTGQFIGKLKYASPEQARGSRDAIDIRSDVYALGVILYQILTDGAFPYAVVGNLVDVLNNIIHSKPTLPSAIVSTRVRSSHPGDARKPAHGPSLVNPAIEAIVMKALEKDPSNRYESAGALGQDIENYLAGRPTSARVKAPVAPPPRTSKRTSLTLTAIVLAVLLTGVVMNARVIASWLGIAALFTSAVAAIPPELDPGPKLDQARIDYERAVEDIRVDINRAFEERDATLRTSGTDEAVDKLTEQWYRFKTTGALPQGMNLSAQLNAYRQQRANLIKAYDAAAAGYRHPQVKLDDLRNQMRDEAKLLADEEDLNPWSSNLLEGVDEAQRTLDEKNPAWTLNGTPSEPFRVQIAGNAEPNADIVIEVPTLDGNGVSLPVKADATGRFRVSLTVRSAAARIEYGADRSIIPQVIDGCDRLEIHRRSGIATLESCRIKLVIGKTVVEAPQAGNGIVSKPDQPRQQDEEKPRAAAPDVAAALQTGSVWISKAANGGVVLWTVTSRTGDSFVIERPSVQSAGTVAVTFMMKGSKFEVTRVSHVGTPGSVLNRNWTGTGSVKGKSINFNFSVESRPPNGVFKRWSESVNATLKE